MNNTFSNFLFDKYQVLRPLGQGSFGSVFLVRHLILDQERAIKIIPRSITDSDSTLFEARLLKSLDHPCIPRIFDIEEDDSNYYIVEEYIQGQSLDQFLLHQPIISINLFMRLSEQLCDIFEYLHSFQPRPVVYRDLKPEHIIVCGDLIKIIDFGISTFFSADNEGNNINHLGNTSFSAPESFTQDSITPLADIFSIGRLLQYMSEHLPVEPSPDIQKIIQKSINPDPLLRYETVSELRLALKTIKIISSSSHLCKTIAVLGSNTGCGCTHIAVSLASTLNYLGYSAVYINRDNSCSLQSALEYDPDIYEKNGYIFYKLFRGIPYYGPGISLDISEDSWKIMDYGIRYEAVDLKAADIILLVCGGSLWNKGNVISAFERLTEAGIRPRIIANLCDSSQARWIARRCKCKIYRYPVDLAPFQVTQQKISDTQELLSLKGVSLSFLKGPFFTKRKR